VRNHVNGAALTGPTTTAKTSPLIDMRAKRPDMDPVTKMAET
jgi:hypothetical protein